MLKKSKYFLSIIIFLLSIISSTAQKMEMFQIQDKIFILGIKKFDSLVSVVPKKQTFEKIDNRETITVLTEKRNMDLLSHRLKDFKYNIFDSACYAMLLFPQSFVWKYLIPIAATEIVDILKNTYPNDILLPKIKIYGDDYISNRFKVTTIVAHQFLVIFVHIPLYNEWGWHIYPQYYRFKNDKAQNGMYIKVLIPLLDED